VIQSPMKSLHSIMESPAKGVELQAKNVEPPSQSSLLHTV
jgi:hypothetical protein